MSARYEGVTAAKDHHFVRFMSSNGREIWRTSQVYKERKSAENAVSVITGQFIQWTEGRAYVWHRDGQVPIHFLEEFEVTERAELPDPASL